MKTVIMVGSRGSILSAIVPDISKPMIKIDGMPVLERELYGLRDQGFTDIILTVSHIERSDYQLLWRWLRHFIGYGITVRRAY